MLLLPVVPSSPRRGDGCGRYWSASSSVRLRRQQFSWHLKKFVSNRTNETRREKTYQRPKRRQTTYLGPFFRLPPGQFPLVSPASCYSVVVSFGLVAVLPFRRHFEADPIPTPRAVARDGVIPVSELVCRRHSPWFLLSVNQWDCPLFGLLVSRQIGERRGPHLVDHCSILLAPVCHRPN